MKNRVLQSNKEQADKLAELGDRLHQFRQNRGVSIEQISATTLIPVRLLNAIEQGNLAQLPEPVYIQGFLRRYADAVGINGAEFASDFPADSSFSMLPKPSWRQSVNAQLRPLHLYALYLLLVVGAVSGLSHLLDRSTPKVTRLPINPTQPIQPSIGPVPPGQVATNPGSAAVTKVAAPAKPVRVGLTLTSQSWLRVVVDGKMEFEGVLPEGTQRSWVANQQVTLRAGNAGGVLVSFNDGQAKPLGEPGSVEEVTFGTKSQSSNISESTEDKTLAASQPSSL